MPFLSFLKHLKNQKQLGVFLLILGLLLGSAGTYWFENTKVSSSPIQEVRVNSNAFTFTNPLLFYKSSSDPTYDYLKNDLSSYIDKVKKDGNATDVSVYFRDMDSGTWTGINETEPYEPASMLKVTLMIAYFKRSVSDPAILSKKLYYTPTNHAEEHYRAKDSLPAGYYSVNDLITYMIKYSDNDALQALSTADDGHTAEVFNLFQLPTPATGTTTDYMSARSYSRVFRILYDSTYLPWDLSEKALKILSNTDFALGLVDGVPQQVVVSHKFGERTIVARDGSVAARELHDCGIVYKTQQPYFLCVMTRGSDFAKQQKIIFDISQKTFNDL